jgi:hypothetical protein
MEVHQSFNDESTELLNSPSEFLAPDVLTRRQVNRCLMDIEEMHPLSYLADLHHCLPIFPCLRRCRSSKPNFKKMLKVTLMKEMRLKLPKDEK